MEQKLNVVTFFIIKVKTMIFKGFVEMILYLERVVGRNWTEKIVVLYSDSRSGKIFKDC